MWVHGSHWQPFCTLVFAVCHLKTSVFRNDELSLTTERGERCRAVGAREFSRSMQSVGRACAAPNGACTGAERCAQDHDYTLESSWHLYSSTVEEGSPRTRFSVSLILSVTAWSWKDLFQTEIISSCSEHPSAKCRHFAAYLPAGEADRRTRQSARCPRATFLVSYGNNRAADFVGGVKLFGDDS